MKLYDAIATGCVALNTAACCECGALKTIAFNENGAPRAYCPVCVHGARAAGFMCMAGGAGRHTHPATASGQEHNSAGAGRFWAITRY